MMNQPSRVDVEYLVARSGLVVEYAAELSHLREACAQHLASFRPSLRRMGENLLQDYAGRWNSVDWTLPLILGAAWSVPQASRQAIALANAQMVMHGHIQQRAGDDRARSSSDLLPLGSLLSTHALRQYQQLFPPSSYFWTLLEGYQLEWVEAALWQRQRRWGRVERYNQEDVLRLAGNRALVKIGGSAIALFAQRPRKLMPLGSVLDQIHVATQLIDGVVNWRQDLQARRATYFLTEVAFAMDAREMAALGRADLEGFLATSSLPGKVAKRALDHLSTAKKVTSHLGAPALMAYLDDLRMACKAIPGQLERDLADVASTAGRSSVLLSLLGIM